MSGSYVSALIRACPAPEWRGHLLRCRAAHLRTSLCVPPTDTLGHRRCVSCDTRYYTAVHCAVTEQKQVEGPLDSEAARGRATGAT